MSTRINSNYTQPRELNDMSFDVSGGSRAIWEHQTITKKNYKTALNQGLILGGLDLLEETEDYKLSEEAKDFVKEHYRIIKSKNLKLFTKVYLEWFFANYPDEVICFG